MRDLQHEGDLEHVQGCSEVPESIVVRQYCNGPCICTQWFIFIFNALNYLSAFYVYFVIMNLSYSCKVVQENANKLE